MARNRFIKTRSNYVLKGLHQTTNVGNVYERDWMTIADLNTYAPGSLPSYGLNGFKMVIDDSINLKKRHQYGSWLKNESCDTISTYWSLKCMDDADEILSSTSPHAILKPDYTSLLDFAYYGSAQMLVQGAVSQIISHFPGEIYLMDTYITIGGKRLYNVDNPFNIDLDSVHFSDEPIDEPLRILSLSYEDYILIKTDGGSESIVSWDRNMMNSNTCTPSETLLSVVKLGFGDSTDSSPAVMLYYYNINGEKRLFHDGYYQNASIRPKNKTINKFFKTLDDFQSLLLNRKTNYTAVLDTPQETDRGNITYKKSYTWPKTGIGDWNIDISSGRYKDYLNSLLKIAEFYDGSNSDNIWRAMTHEAIIAYDWTLTRVNQDGFQEETDSPNSKRIKAILQIAGREFDEIKKYVDGISYSNTVTYDEVKNNPDNFLSDTLTNYGWDIKIPIPTKLSKYTTLPLYPSHVDGYSVHDANTEFYRRLLLNSAAILSAKGTKKSIEMVLSLFGYRSLNFVEHSFHDIFRNGKVVTVHWDDLFEDERKDILRNVYDITEYVYVAGDANRNGLYSMGATENVKRVNSQKMTYDSSDLDEFQGLPLREVLIPKEREGETVIESYLIPWYDRNKKYDSDIYFESKGGWGLTQTKTTTVPEYGDVYIETSDELKIYDEGVKYLKFRENIEDLLNCVGEYPKVNDVYYVYDISDAEKYDFGILYDEDKPTLSHYFILKSYEHDDVFGVLRGANGKVLINESTGEIDGSKVSELYEDTYNDKNRATIPDYPNIPWAEYPEKLYGWKNISEEELKAGKSKDAQKVFYLESIVENNLGNAPHSGKGEYDDGEEYRVFYEDMFKSAKENDEFEFVDDSELPWVNTELSGYTGFTLTTMIDNVKCWYFTDLTIAHDIEVLYLNENGEYVGMGNQVPSVGAGDFVRFSKSRDFEGDRDSAEQNLFNSAQYDYMEPYNMEGGEIDDEASANSIVNTKALYIEFIPDLQSPDSMYEFIDDSAMHYVKQIIPSTTLFKYKVPMTGWDVFCYDRTYIQSALLNNE